MGQTSPHYSFSIAFVMRLRIRNRFKGGSNRLVSQHLLCGRQSVSLYAYCTVACLTPMFAVHFSFRNERYRSVLFIFMATPQATLLLTVLHMLTWIYDPVCSFLGCSNLAKVRR